MAKDKVKAKEEPKPRRPPDKMMLFAHEYFIDCNGTRAYKAVYGQNLSDNSAAVSASKLLRNPKVCAETERLFAEVANRRNERKARVTAGLEEIAYSDDSIDVTRDREGEILEVSRKDKIRAYELLGKMEGMFTDVVKNDTTVEIKHTFDPKGI